MQKLSNFSRPALFMERKDKAWFVIEFKFGLKWAFKVFEKEAEVGQNREVVVGILSIEIAFDRSCLCLQDNAIRDSFGNLVLEKHYLVTDLVHDYFT